MGHSRGRVGFRVQCGVRAHIWRKLHHSRGEVKKSQTIRGSNTQLIHFKRSWQNGSLCRQHCFPEKKSCCISLHRPKSHIHLKKKKIHICYVILLSYYGFLMGLINGCELFFSFFFLSLCFLFYFEIVWCNIWKEKNNGG